MGMTPTSSHFAVIVSVECELADQILSTSAWTVLLHYEPARLSRNLGSSPPAKVIRDTSRSLPNRAWNRPLVNSFSHLSSFVRQEFELGGREPVELDRLEPLLTSPRIRGSPRVLLPHSVTFPTDNNLTPMVQSPPLTFICDFLCPKHLTIEGPQLEEKPFARARDPTSTLRVSLHPRLTGWLFNRLLLFNCWKDVRVVL